MIKVSLNDKIRQCDHCQAKNIKRTFEIKVKNVHTKEIQTLYIGRICIGKIAGVDTSGNPARAAKKIEEKLNRIYKNDNFGDDIFEFLDD